MKLRLASDLSMPAEAITETFAILAARGAGKSNTAAVMAEEMFEARLPFCVVDPVGSWWGLRSSADGSGAGLPIAIFGGPKGDVPLERKGGNLIADIIVDERISCVLDLRSFESEAAKKEFLLDFARRIYQRNEAPLHLFLEEADDYIPQKPMREEAHLLRAWENIVRRGRSRGLGMTMITQRSASLNKNVLTQAQTLIAMRTTGPQDRKAIEEWVKYNDQSLDILESLAGLEDGEAWVWSPQFLKVTKRVQFRRRGTFDSGSTPKMAAKGKTATLADIDVSSLRVRMADTIERAAADDPKALKARIRELEAAGKRAPSVAPAPAPAAPRDRAAEQEQSRRIAALERNNAALKEYSDQLFAGAALSQTLVEELEEKVRALRAVRYPRQPKLVDVVQSSAPVARTVTPAPARQPTVAPAPRPRANGDGGSALEAGPRRCLIAIVQYAHKGGLASKKLRALTGYAERSISTHVSALRVAGFVSDGWPVLPTDAGVKTLGDYEPLPEGDALLQWWLSELEEGPRRILSLLAAERGSGLTRGEIMQRSEYAERSVSTHLSTLRIRDLIAQGAGRIHASEELFG